MRPSEIWVWRETCGRDYFYICLTTATGCTCLNIRQPMDMKKSYNYVSTIHAWLPLQWKAVRSFWVNVLSLNSHTFSSKTVKGEGALTWLFVILTQFSHGKVTDLSSSFSRPSQHSSKKMLPHSCQFIQISLLAHLASEACLWWPVGPISSLFSLCSPQTHHYLSAVQTHPAMSTCPGCPNWPPEARRSQPGGSSQSEQRKLPATSPHPGPRVWRVINKNNHKIIWKLNIIALLQAISLLIIYGSGRRQCM